MNIKIIENFLDPEYLSTLQSLDIKPTEQDQIKIYQNIIIGDRVIQNDCISDVTLKSLNSHYHNKAINILKELYDYSDFFIIETGANYKFPIHDDTPNKLLSGVVYLKPEENSGTIFYKNKKGDDKKEIGWKVNKAVFFSRSERNTWHSYQGDGKKNRLVLVYNLMTKRIKEVYKIEKKNYFLGMFRYKINYYLYRYFKFTI